MNAIECGAAVKMHILNPLKQRDLKEIVERVSRVVRWLRYCGGSENPLFLGCSLARSFGVLCGRSVFELAVGAGAHSGGDPTRRSERRRPVQCLKSARGKAAKIKIADSLSTVVNKGYFQTTNAVRPHAHTATLEMSDLQRLTCLGTVHFCSSFLRHLV